MVEDRSTLIRIRRWIVDYNGRYGLESTVRLAAINYESRSSGPGIRTEIFFQGCTRACPGCFSSETWDVNGGDEFRIGEVLEFIAPRPGDPGFPPLISICGGEPLLQQDALEILLVTLRQMCQDLDLGYPNILLYTGYELCDIPMQIRRLVDIVVTGPFVEELNVYRYDVPTDFVGSQNQAVTVLFNGQPLTSVRGADANRYIEHPSMANALNDVVTALRTPSEV